MKLTAVATLCHDSLSIIIFLCNPLYKSNITVYNDYVLFSNYYANVCFYHMYHGRIYDHPSYFVREL